VLKVTTLFYSIQGEGTNVGKASIFIRLYGCNLECSFCDDHWHKEAYQEQSFEQILKQIKIYPSKNIIITGGEPSIYDLNEFIAFMQSHHYNISVETNGYKFENIQQANWITYSPKDWNIIYTTGYNELKCIVNTDSDIQPLLDLEIEQSIFIQAENYFDTIHEENSNYCVELVKRYPKFRLSVQIHKFLGVE
jgi:organic radical activating enzyme